MKAQTILLVADEKNDFTKLISLLEKKYNVACYNASREYAKIKDDVSLVSAAILPVTEAAYDDFAVFKWVQQDSLLSEIPMFVYCGSEEKLGLAEKCLSLGAVDVIMPPIYESLLLRRIENGMRLKSSATFPEIARMLKELPSNIYLKDEKGRYVFATHYWHHLDHSNDPDWTIRGKTDIEIRKDKENAKKAMATDLEMIKTGVGKRYVIEERADGVSDYLEIIKEPLKDDTGRVTGIIALINNVTEMVLMRKQIEEMSIHDVMTGLRNKCGYEIEVRRVEEEHNINGVPYGVVMIDMNSLKHINDTYGHERGNEAIISLSKLISEVYKHSPVFRVGGDEFVVILEKSQLEKRDKLLEQLMFKMQLLSKNESLMEWERVSASVGMAVFDDICDNCYMDVFRRADQKMYDFKKDYKGHTKMR